MSKIEEIKNIKSLLDQGAITQDEFNLLKSKVLSSKAISINPETQVNTGGKSTVQANRINTTNQNTAASNVKPPLAGIPPNSNNSTINPVYFAKLAFYFIVVGFCLYLVFGKSEGTSSSNSDYGTKVKVENKIVCNRCNGTGIEVCHLCGGTGENNLGMTCSCITMYSNMIQMGHTPDHEPLRWTCTKCKGTGYASY